MIAAYTSEIERRVRRIEEIKASFREMLPDDHARAEFGGVIVTRTVARGPVDYKKAWTALPESCRQSEKDLELFRRKDSIRFDVKSTTDPLPEDVIDPSIIEPLNLPPRSGLWF